MERSGTRFGKDIRRDQRVAGGFQVPLVEACGQLRLVSHGFTCQAIGAWLGGAMSHAMCGAQVLESMVRGDAQ